MHGNLSDMYLSIQPIPNYAIYLNTPLYRCISNRVTTYGNETLRRAFWGWYSQGMKHSGKSSSLLAKISWIHRYRSKLLMQRNESNWYRRHRGSKRTIRKLIQLAHLPVHPGRTRLDVCIHEKRPDRTLNQANHNRSSAERPGLSYPGWKKANEKQGF